MTIDNFFWICPADEKAQRGWRCGIFKDGTYFVYLRFDPARHTMVRGLKVFIPHELAEVVLRPKFGGREGEVSP
jgi:hypothetical protein